MNIHYNSKVSTSNLSPIGEISALEERAVNALIAEAQRSVAAASDDDIQDVFRHYAARLLVPMPTLDISQAMQQRIKRVRALRDIRDRVRPRLNHEFVENVCRGLPLICCDNAMKMKPRSGNGHAAADATKERQHSTAALLRTKVFEPIKYIVPGYIAEGCTILAGRPKLGKSWLMLDIGLAVARGSSCLGETKCEQGDVLYLALEDNERRLQSRITKILGSADEWPARFCYATEWPRADAGGLEEIGKWICSAEKPRLVVVDILAMFRSPRGKEQQLYESDYTAIQGLQAIASKTGVAIVIVHHLRKSLSEVDPFEKVSGTLGLSGAADTVLILDRDARGCTLYGRGRDIEEVEQAVQFDKGTCRWTVLGAAIEVRRTDERAKILSVLASDKKPMSPCDIAAGTGMPRNNVDQLLLKMAKAGEVLKTSRGHYKHPSSTPPDKNDKKIRKGKLANGNQQSGG